MPFRGDKRFQAQTLRGERVVRERPKHHAQRQEVQEIREHTNDPFRPADGFDLRFDVKEEVGDGHDSFEKGRLLLVAFASLYFCICFGLYFGSIRHLSREESYLLVCFQKEMYRACFGPEVMLKILSCLIKAFK